MLAGLFAARRGVPTLLCETRREPGAKIRVSGGARCNVLPSVMDWADFHSGGSMHSVRKVLQSWPLEEVRAFFEQDLGIALKVEDTGKVFPVSEDPREVVVGLLNALEAAQATLVGDFRIASLRRVQERGAMLFELESADGRKLLAQRVCLSTGGLSLPKTGSDGRGFDFARELGHGVLALYPALVPLLAADARWAELAGVSLPVRLRVLRGQKLVQSHDGDFLFTHKGFSGPVVLDVSHHFSRPAQEPPRLFAHWGGARVDWEAALLRGGASTLAVVLREHLPRRLAALLLERAALDGETRCATLTREARRRLVRELADCELELGGDEGYRTAEVTDGGIALSEVEPRALESRLVPGLHFAGEMLDATGRIGGYNFLWAFVTGRKAGLGIARAR
jgi:predicted Rossmann fold flavoprotein